MNTATHHRRGTAFAVVVLALALPLAACQTPAGGAPVAPAQMERRVAPTPSPLPTPGPTATDPAAPTPRELCLESAAARGVRSTAEARALCGVDGPRHAY
jgi:hypothetical protein